jgi:hypothetical protein
MIMVFLVQMPNGFMDDFRDATMDVTTTMTVATPSEFAL